MTALTKEHSKSVLSIPGMRRLFTAPNQRLRRNALGVLLTLAILPSDGVGIDLCPFHLLTGLICPLCGLCRSISSFLHGEWLAGFRYHPLGIGVIVFLGFLIVFNRIPLASIGRLGFYSERGRVLTAGVVVLGVWVIRLWVSGS